MRSARLGQLGWVRLVRLDQVSHVRIGLDQNSSDNVRSPQIDQLRSVSSVRNGPVRSVSSVWVWSGKVGEASKLVNLRSFRASQVRSIR